MTLCWGNLEVSVPAMDETLRAFIAVPLPPSMKEVLGQLQKQMRTGGLRARWTKPANCHLTLAFLGEFPSRKVAPLLAALTEMAKQVPAFDLRLQGLGVFPNIRRPRVLWCGVGGQTDILLKLYRGVVKSVSSVGIEFDARPFKAHITLGRFNKPSDSRLTGDTIRDLGGFSTPLEVEQIQLIRSRLTPSGPIYTPLGAVPLVAPG